MDQSFLWPESSFFTNMLVPPLSTTQVSADTFNADAALVLANPQLMVRLSDGRIYPAGLALPFVVAKLAFGDDALPVDQSCGKTVCYTVVSNHRNVTNCAVDATRSSMREGKVHNTREKVSRMALQACRPAMGLEKEAVLDGPRLLRRRRTTAHRPMMAHGFVGGRVALQFKLNRVHPQHLTTTIRTGQRAMLAAKQVTPVGTRQGSRMGRQVSCQSQVTPLAAAQRVQETSPT